MKWNVSQRGDRYGCDMDRREAESVWIILEEKQRPGRPLLDHRVPRTQWAEGTDR